MCGPGRARLQSCPSRNLRECEFFFCGGGENITGGARLLVVPLGPRFRSVIPRNFSSEESALQLLRDREQSFPRRLPPARDYERRGSIGTAEAVPFPTLGNSRADTIRLRFVSGHAFMRVVRVGRFASCRGRCRRGHYASGTTFSRAVMAALSFCHSEELRFRGICFAALRDREQSFPRRLPPARGFQKRGSIGTAEAVPFPTLGNSRADTIRLRFVSGHAFMRAVRVGRFASCRGRRRREHYGRGTTFSRAVRAPLSFCHSEELQFRGICFAASPDREQGFPRRLPPARDDERRSSIGTSKLVPFPKSARM